MSEINSYDELFNCLEEDDIHKLFDKERMSFPDDFTLEKKLMCEVISVQAYISDYLSNESEFEPSFVSDTFMSLNEIEIMIENQEYEKAATEVVILQLQLDLDIKLGSVLVDVIQSGLDLENITRKRKK